VHPLLESAGLQLRVAKRLVPRRGASLKERVGPLDDRFVFVLGSPRSGTTFLAGAIGSLPGFVDLGEVPPVKSGIPELATLPAQEAAHRLLRILAVARRVGLVGTVRPVEQTPEMAFLVDAAACAYPHACFVHVVRDGRDVVCSLLEKQWLKASDNGRDDAGLPYGAHARFWVEADRGDEFANASDARRAAWAWRTYVTAARSARADLVEVRYERLVSQPGAVAAELADALDAPRDGLATALDAAHSGSVGRHRSELSHEQLAEVVDEAGELLAELGYLPAT
jgi:sulfotransferase family protein